MSAQIIPFPRKRPLQEHELPAHWSDGLKGYYVHVTYDGYETHERAFNNCESVANFRPRRKEESEWEHDLAAKIAAMVQKEAQS